MPILFAYFSDFAVRKNLTRTTEHGDHHNVADEDRTPSLYSPSRV